MKTTIPLLITSKRTKYLEMNFTTKVKDLYTEMQAENTSKRNQKYIKTIHVHG